MKAATALVVGGGVAGMSAAIVLARSGWSVELVEQDPAWKAYGAGITLTGPTLRALSQLGVFDAIAAEAHTADGIDVCSVDGVVRQVLPTPTPAGSTVPGGGGVLRPVLHRILADRVTALGCTVRLGVGLSALDPRGEAAEATFSDGSHGRYHLVVGADGAFSKTRRLLFPDAGAPAYTGQVCWRTTAPRPPEVTRRRYILGGPVKVGLSPVSHDQMYMFLLQSIQPKPHFGAGLHLILKGMLAGYGGAVGDLRDALDAASPVVPRPLEGLLVPAPWHFGRAILIGDAAHPTTPHLASGAGLAVEDALVLGQALAQSATVEEAFAAFMARRFARCALVVENSMEIGRREQAGRPPSEQTELVERSLHALAEPI